MLGGKAAESWPGFSGQSLHSCTVLAQRRGRGREDSYRILGAVVSICPAPSCQYLSGLNSAFVWSWIQYLSAQLQNVLYSIFGWIELGCDICIAIGIVESQICGWGRRTGWTCYDNPIILLSQKITMWYQWSENVKWKYAKVKNIFSLENGVYEIYNSCATMWLCGSQGWAISWELWVQEWSPI